MFKITRQRKRCRPITDEKRITFIFSNKTCQSLSNMFWTVLLPWFEKKVKTISVSFDCLVSLHFMTIFLLEFCFFQ